MYLLLSICIIALVTWWMKNRLTCEAITLFGSVLLAIGVIALALDWLSDVVTAIPVAKNEVGDWLYGMGPEVSILGGWWWAFCLAALWGLVLLIVSRIKRSSMMKQTSQQRGDAVAPAPKEPTEEENIRRDLTEEVARMRQNASSPEQAGKEDATRDGGPIPKETDRGPPPGEYERGARQRYEELGNSFLTKTIQKMEQAIKDAMTTLADIKSQVVGRSYEAIARAKYQEKEQTLSPLQVRNKQDEFHQTAIKRKAFIESLNLGAAESEDWSDKRTTLQSLLYWGGAFALIEFATSYYFLEGEIGGQTAIWLSAVAVVIIIVLASCAGWLPQFMRRNNRTHTRIFSSALLACVFLFAFMGIGLLLGYRGVDDGLATVIWGGYNSLFDNLTNFVVFVVNVAAFGIVFWKVLLKFNKFHGFDKVDKAYTDAKAQWEEMDKQSDDNIARAIKKADDAAKENRKAAEQAMKTISRKKDALLKIRETVSGVYKAVLHGSYNEDIRKYRSSNRENRTLTVYPCPGYFDDAPVEIGDISKHFENNGGSEEFLNAESQRLKQAESDHAVILEHDQKWGSQKQPLRTELSNAFAGKLRRVRLGDARTSASDGVNDESNATAEVSSAVNS